MAKKQTKPQLPVRVKAQMADDELVQEAARLRDAINLVFVELSMRDYDVEIGMRNVDDDETIPVVYPQLDIRIIRTLLNTRQSGSQVVQEDPLDDEEE